MTVFQSIQDKKNYRCDLTQHVKIWLTTHPDRPFGIINEYRILDFLKSNPHAHLTIIIDKSLYSPLGQERFERFCQMLGKPEFEGAQNRIRFLDLDEIEKACHSENDHQLMEAVRTEIREKLPGWPAIASDILRVTTPVAKLGIYSDFDLRLSLGDTKEVLLWANIAVGIYYQKKEINKIAPKLLLNPIEKKGDGA